MSGPSGGGGDAHVTVAVEKLASKIGEDNDAISRQNNKMVKYTKQLVWLTYVIGFLGVIQLIAVLVQIFKK